MFLHFAIQRYEIPVRELLKTLKALSDTQRLRILKMLEVRPLCVCEITDVLGLAQSTVSKHLAILRDVELILDEKDGKWVNYSLNVKGRDRRMARLLDLVGEWLPEDETIRKDAAKVRKVDRDVLCRI
jgi:ArsR family transcriptional regulator